MLPFHSTVLRPLFYINISGFAQGTIMTLSSDMHDLETSSTLPITTMAGLDKFDGLELPASADFHVHLR